VRITAAQKQLQKKKRLRGSNFKLMLATNANFELLPYLMGTPRSAAAIKES
jgi:hypothetical protein